MTYAIIECINGNFYVRAEGIKSLESAKTTFHARCNTLWAAQDVRTAQVMIADEQLDVVEGYKEFIHHDLQPSEIEA